MLKHFLLLLPVAGLLVGCGATVATLPEVAEPQAVAIDVKPQPAINEEKIAALLALAKAAFDRDSLMRPKADNAYDWYRQVLAIDGANEAAHQGLRAMGKRYLQLAEHAFQQNRRQRAEHLLARGLEISVIPSQAEALRQRYPYRPPAANEYLLPKSALVKKTDALFEMLSELAKRAKELPSRLLIVARNDAEGRWIYKQMRSSVDGYRLRGNISIGQRPKIILIDQPKQSVMPTPSAADEDS